jgi:DNA-binding CsgD family transcriptional regulator
MKTVDAHRRHMREKLNLRSTNELIRYATQWVASGARVGPSEQPA